MSITAAELIVYGSANLPQDDVSTSGGAIDATRRPALTQMASLTKIEVLSDVAGDTVRTITIQGRDSTGAFISETLTLNGTTVVTSANTYERILTANTSATHATATVTVRQAVAGATISTVPPNETGFYVNFINSFSDPSVAKDRYEKIFWKNTNASLTLTSSQVTLTADPSGKLTMGLASAVNDSASVANRTTAPAGVTFVGVGVAQNVPGGGNLAAASAIGTWIHQALLAGDAAIRQPYTTQLSGNTT
jgi:hypothetical protein